MIQFWVESSQERPTLQQETLCQTTNFSFVAVSSFVIVLEESLAVNEHLEA